MTTTDLDSFLASPDKYTNVNLESKDISDEDCMKIACTLKENKTVAELALPRNSISDKGVEALMGLMKMTTSLQCLNLNRNPISNEAALKFQSAWDKTRDSNNLDMYDLNISERKEDLSYNEAEILYLLGKSEFPGPFYDIVGTDGVVSLDLIPMLVFYKLQHPEWKNSDGENLFQKYESGDISEADKEDLDKKIKKAAGEYFVSMPSITDEEIQQSKNPERVEKLLKYISSNPFLPNKTIIQNALVEEINTVQDAFNGGDALIVKPSEQNTLLGEEAMTEDYFGCIIL